MAHVSVLTVSALDMGLNKTFNYMGKVCRGFANSPGHKQVPVHYPATLDPSAGTNPRGSIFVGATNLDMLIRATPGPKVVLGYSQGAQVVGTWLRRFARTAGAPDPAELSFVVIGNPERRVGKQPWTLKVTPDDTQYQVRDVARRGDKWANWHGKPTDNRVLAMFGGTHTDYWRSDIYDPAGRVIETAGNTTYVLIP